MLEEVGVSVSVAVARIGEPARPGATVHSSALVAAQAELVLDLVGKTIAVAVRHGTAHARDRRAIPHEEAGHLVDSLRRGIVDVEEVDLCAGGEFGESTISGLRHPGHEIDAFASIE